jgi:TusA-related sulfurtransferase
MVTSLSDRSRTFILVKAAVSQCVFSGVRTMTSDAAPPQELTADSSLDISAETCPMTFVRTRLMLDRMAEGQTLLVRLRGEEPRANVPRTAVEQGHALLGQWDAPDGATLVLLRKAAAPPRAAGSTPTAVRAGAPPPKPR